MTGTVAARLILAVADVGRVISMLGDDRHG